jgi:hypothetical protein
LPPSSKEPQEASDERPCFTRLLREYRTINNSHGGYGSDWQKRADKFRQKGASKLPQAVSQSFQIVEVTATQIR